MGSAAKEAGQALDSAGMLELRAGSQTQLPEGATGQFERERAASPRGRGRPRKAVTASRRPKGEQTLDRYVLRSAKELRKEKERSAFRSVEKISRTPVGQKITAPVETIDEEFVDNPESWEDVEISESEGQDENGDLITWEDDEENNSENAPEETSSEDIDNNNNNNDMGSLKQALKQIQEEGRRAEARTYQWWKREITKLQKEIKEIKEAKMCDCQWDQRASLGVIEELKEEIKALQLQRQSDAATWKKERMELLVTIQRFSDKKDLEERDTGGKTNCNYGEAREEEDWRLVNNRRKYTHKNDENRTTACEKGVERRKRPSEEEIWGGRASGGGNSSLISGLSDLERHEPGGLGQGTLPHSPPGEKAPSPPDPIPEDAWEWEMNERRKNKRFISIKGMAVSGTAERAREQITWELRKRLDIDPKIDYLGWANRNPAVRLASMEIKKRVMQRKAWLAGSGIWIEDVLTHREEEVQDWLRSYGDELRRNRKAVRVGYQKISIDDVWWNWSEKEGKLIKGTFRRQQKYRRGGR